MKYVASAIATALLGFWLMSTFIGPIMGRLNALLSAGAGGIR